jgi:hypothetical protein
MGIGGGFMKQMNDSIKYNRALLGKKKSLREVYKDELKRRSGKYGEEALTDVRERVTMALRRNRTQEIYGRIIAFLILAFLIFGAIWAFNTINFTPKKKILYNNPSSIFNTKIYDMPDGTQLKTDYYKKGPKAADTKMENGLKHQNAESYYQTGEKFRSALFNYDTLLIDIYFYKTGDTIVNFPTLSDAKVHRLKFLNKEQDKVIEFDYFDGKIIPGTYKEKSVER